MDIKRMSLIYTINTWAVYEERMMQFPKNLKSISIRMSDTSLGKIDIRFGMLCILPSMWVQPDFVKIELDKGYPIYEKLSRAISARKDLKRVHLAWTIKPIEME